MAYQSYRLEEVDGMMPRFSDGIMLQLFSMPVVQSSIAVSIIVSVLPKSNFSRISVEAREKFSWGLVSLFVIILFAIAALKPLADKRKVQYPFEHMSCNSIRVEAYEIAVNVEIGSYYVEPPINTLEKKRKNEIVKRKRNHPMESPTKYANKLEYECTNNEGWWSYRQ